MVSLLNSNKRTISKNKKLDLDILCSICYHDIESEDEAILACNHKFCFGCIKEWTHTKNSCPNCKTEFEEISHKNVMVKIENLRYIPWSGFTDSRFIETRRHLAKNLEDLPKVFEDHNLEVPLD